MTGTERGREARSDSSSLVDLAMEVEDASVVCSAAVPGGFCPVTWAAAAFKPQRPSLSWASRAEEGAFLLPCW